MAARRTFGAVEATTGTRVRASKALARARGALAVAAAEPIEKTIWSSPAGKKRLAKRLVAMLPPHRTYVEPFCGSAAVLFAKEPAAVEVINDTDSEIAEAYRAIKRLTPKKLARLRKLSWVGDEGTFKRLLKTTPQTDVETLHRFLYLTHFSYGKMRGSSFSPSIRGIEARTVARIEKHAPRLKNVRVHRGDYLKVVKKYDAADTVFFFDPPYAGYDADVGESKFDEERFFGVLKGLKGKFLLTYGIRGKLPKLLKSSRFNVRRIRTPRTIRSMRGVGGSEYLTQLVVTNYALTKKCADALVDEGVELEPWEPAGEPDSDGGGAFEKSIPLIKGADPSDERYVLGVVMEPEKVDSQGDIYSAAEIRQAAHRFMEHFGELGIQHQLPADGDVKILETYLAPADFEVAGAPIRKGTWVLAVRVLSDVLWEQVRGGVLTGFSIGGSARKVPEPAPGAPDAGEQLAEAAA